MKVYEKARKFVFQNARPLDLARFEYLFEKGNKEKVVKALTAYQNNDGGFGSGLAADCWNENSSPMQTWSATEIMSEIDLPPDHPLVVKTLEYLASGKDFDGTTWGNSVATNNSYPHAPWWEYEPNAPVNYNPTACLAGFILKNAPKGSSLLALGEQTAKTQ